MYGLASKHGNGRDFGQGKKGRAISFEIFFKLWGWEEMDANAVLSVPHASCTSLDGSKLVSCGGPSNIFIITQVSAKMRKTTIRLRDRLRYFHFLKSKSNIVIRGHTCIQMRFDLQYVVLGFIAFVVPFGC